MEGKPNELEERSGLDVLTAQERLEEPVYHFHDEAEFVVAASAPTGDSVAAVAGAAAPPPLELRRASPPSPDLPAQQAGLRRARESIFWISIEKIEPNPYQPREEIQEESLTGLADSIREHGVLQPLLVSKRETETSGGLDVRYELIAGERRWRAAKLAGLREVPVIIRSPVSSEHEKLELALIENVQREDLNPIERARAFQRLLDEFGMIQREIADRIGKSREYVSNALRLLGLPEGIQATVAAGDLSEGHARAILMLSDPERQRLLFERIRTVSLSVRDTELAAKSLGARRRRGRGARTFDPDLWSLQERLEEAFGTKVLVEKQGERGKIILEFYSQEELANILDRIGAPGEDGAV